MLDGLDRSRRRPLDCNLHGDELTGYRIPANFCRLRHLKAPYAAEVQFSFWRTLLGFQVFMSEKSYQHCE